MFSAVPDGGSGGARAPKAVPDLSGLSQAQKLARLRHHLAGHHLAGQDPARRMLPVPAPVAELLPGGGLPGGSVVGVGGARLLLLALLAQVTAAGGHAAVVALPDLGLLAAAELGADLGRLAVVADPSPDPLEVAAVLLDGMDVVVLGADRAVTPARAQVVAARARGKGAVLIVSGAPWPGLDLRFEARVSRCEGVGRGHGRLRCLLLAVRAWGRSFPERRGLVRLEGDRGLVRVRGAQDFPGATAQDGPGAAGWGAR